ncbi:MAG: MFS transporter [Actinomycetota bacterium]
MESEIDQAAESPADLPRVIRRNTILLAIFMGLGWGVVQLIATLAAPVLSDLTGRAALAGVAPAIFLGSWAVATLVTGRYMDVRGRGPGIRAGFLAAAAGCVLMYFGIRERSLALFVPGLAFSGGGLGAVNVARTGAADMYPPERRARGISFVLVGAAFGAILGPVAFIPLLARSGTDLAVLADPVAAAGVAMLVGATTTVAIRIDPVVVARRLRHRTATADAADPSRSIRAMLDVPVVRVALVAAVVAQAVMSSLMGTVALILHDHGHGWPSVSISLSAHFLGMFGLVLVVGRLVDRVGRQRSLLVGFAVLAAGSLGLLWRIEVGSVAPAMFAVGVGWNLAYVAATAMMADASIPLERARLLGFSDFVALGTGAAAAALAGVVFGTLGLGALAGISAAASLIPVVLFLRNRPTRRAGVLRLTPTEPRC